MLYAKLGSNEILKIILCRVHVYIYQVIDVTKMGWCMYRVHGMAWNTNAFEHDIYSVCSAMICDIPLYLVIDQITVLPETN